MGNYNYYEGCSIGMLGGIVPDNRRDLKVLNSQFENKVSLSSKEM